MPVSSNTITTTVNSLPSYTLSSVTATDPTLGGTCTVTVVGTVLPDGVYTVTYNLSGDNSATGNTATMTVSGLTGSFVNSTIANPGATTISIVGLKRSTDNCTGLVSNNITVIVSISSVTLTTSGNFNVPKGVTCIKVEAWGAGGGGGNLNTIGHSGGGGGGAYASSFVAVTPSSVIPYQVGAGGNPGTDGSSTIFNTTSPSVKADGGNAGVGGTFFSGVTPGGSGGSTSNSIGTILYAGGNG